MGYFGHNFGTNFAGELEVQAVVEPKKTVTADLCVNESVKKDLCV